MTESSIFPSSQNKVIEYGVGANMRRGRAGYEFWVSIQVIDNRGGKWGSTLPSPQRVFETVFLLNEDLYVKTFKKTIVALSELLFPESKEKERELKRAFFASVIPAAQRSDNVLFARSGFFLFPVDKSLPTTEEIASKLVPIYGVLSNEVVESDETDSLEPQLKEREKDKAQSLLNVSGKKIKDSFIQRELDCLLFKLQIVLRTHECEKEVQELLSFLMSRLDKIRGALAEAVVLTYKEYKILTALILMYDQTVEVGENNLNYLVEAKKLLEDISNREMSVLHIWEYRLNLFLDCGGSHFSRSMIVTSLDLIEEILKDSSLKEKIEEDKDFCQKITNFFHSLYNSYSEGCMSKMLLSLEKKIREIQGREK